MNRFCVSLVLTACLTMTPVRAEETPPPPPPPPPPPVANELTGSELAIAPIDRSSAGSEAGGAAGVEAGSSSTWETPGGSLTERVRQKLALIRKYRKIGFPHPDQTVEEFRVGAQYRGPMTRSFPDLGTGAIECRKLPGGQFEVRLYARVTHPEDDKEVIEFDVTRTFTLEGDRIKVLDEKNSFNEVAAEHKTKILNTVSLAYLIKWRSPEKDGGPFGTDVYRIDDKTFTVNYEVERSRDYWDTGRWLVARLDDGEGNRAKFYLRRTYRGVRPLDKFRVFTRDKVVISFYIQS